MYLRISSYLYIYFFLSSTFRLLHASDFRASGALFFVVEMKQRWELQPLCEDMSGWWHSVDSRSAYTVRFTTIWTMISEGEYDQINKKMFSRIVFVV